MPLIVVAVAGGAAMILASSLGRWLAVLLAVAASQTYLRPAALLALFALSARRESRRPAPLAPASR